MLPMSNSDVQPGAIETQQMRVIAPVGVRLFNHFLHWYELANCLGKAQVRLRLRIAYTIGGQAVQDQVDFSGFPPELTSGSS